MNCNLENCPVKDNHTICVCGQFRQVNLKKKHFNKPSIYNRCMLLEGRKANHKNFSSEPHSHLISFKPPQNPQPSIIMFFKFQILEDKPILGHKI